MRSTSSVNYYIPSVRKNTHINKEILRISDDIFRQYDDIDTKLDAIDRIKLGVIKAVRLA
jgi:hypothetical protein